MAFPAPPAPACVTVTLTAPLHAQVFSAAYRGRLDPADPRAGYLGDAGRCTNVAGVAGAVVRYSFDAAARTPFAVDVEDCGSAGLVPPYLLDVRAGAAAALDYVRAGARGKGETVTVRWRVAGRVPRAVFTLYREERGRLVRVDALPLVARRAGAYSLVDRRAPLERGLRYWIRARVGEAWAWHGPVTAR